MYFVHINYKNHIFKISQSTTGLISTLHKSRIMFALKYILILGHAFTCLSTKQKTKWKFSKCYVQNTWKIVRRWDHQLTHLHHSYRLFKKCFVENYEQLKKFISSLFLIRFTSMFHCSIQFVDSFYWINLNLDWISRFNEGNLCLEDSSVIYPRTSFRFNPIHCQRTSHHPCPIAPTRHPRATLFVDQCCVTRVGTRTRVQFFFTLTRTRTQKIVTRGPSHARVQAVAAVPCCAVYSEIHFVVCIHVLEDKQMLNNYVDY